MSEPKPPPPAPERKRNSRDKVIHAIGGVLTLFQRLLQGGTVPGIILLVAMVVVFVYIMLHAFGPIRVAG